jgi:tetratricopeptide (TPR) repeat protein
VAKKKKKRGARKLPHRAPRSAGSTGRGHPASPFRSLHLRGPVPEALETAMMLMSRHRYAEAVNLLLETDREHPNQREVLQLLLQAARLSENNSLFMTSCERLARLSPNDPEIQLIRGSALFTCRFPALALQAYRDFLQRWPNHPEADNARGQLATLEPIAKELFQELGPPRPDIEELARQHDQIQVELALGHYTDARRVAERLLQRWPDFIPAMNNLAEACYHDGLLADAVATARRAVAAEPENTHALANLVRLLVVTGQLEEAESLAPRLRTIKVQRADNRAKLAEAFSLLGDDEAVIGVWRDGEKELKDMMPNQAAALLHLAAVASFRQGKEKQAHELWNACLRQVPNFSLARENLDDLKKPIAERHAPWPFDLPAWIPFATHRDLGRRMTREPEDVPDILNEFLKAHPEVACCIPLLLDRGDPRGRELAYRLALASEQRTLKEALRDFALSQRGPDKFRLDAATNAKQAGLISTETVRIWNKGAWRELRLLGFEIVEEIMPYSRHSPQVEELLAEGSEALARNDVRSAERLYRQALALEPEAPDVQYNLGATRASQGDVRAFRELLEDLHARHPDYLFAAAQLAQYAIFDGNLERALQLLDPLINRSRLHISEFKLLATVEIDYCLAMNHKEGASHWLTMLEGVVPDYPNLPQLRRRVKGW